MSAPTELLAIRHAPVAVEGICYGRTDVPTTLTAAEASDRIAAAVTRHAPHTIWSSDALRCHGPAALLATRLGTAHRVDARLREMSYGDWEGLGWDEVPRPDLDRWMAEWQVRSPPGGETVAAFAGRVAGWWEELEAGPHFLMAHAGVVHCLDVVAGGLSWEATLERRLGFLERKRFTRTAGA